MTPDPATRRPGELLFAAALLVFAVSAFWQSYGISGFSGKTTPGVFPMAASAVMVISGAVILITAVRTPPPPQQTPGFFSEVLPLNHIVLIGLVLGYVVLMPLAGFIISSALFLFCTFQFLWRRNPLVILGLTAVTLTAVYLIFREVFQVVLPQGRLLQGMF